MLRTISGSDFSLRFEMTFFLTFGTAPKLGA